MSNWYADPASRNAELHLAVTTAQNNIKLYTVANANDCLWDPRKCSLPADFGDDNVQYLDQPEFSGVTVNKFQFSRSDCSPGVCCSPILSIQVAQFRSGTDLALYPVR